MSLYWVTIPVTVETHANDPGEAVRNAERAIEVNSVWAIHMPAIGARTLVRMSRLARVPWKRS